jgi:hypothetical protein
MPPVTYQMIQDAYQRAARGSSQPHQIVLTKKMKAYLDSILDGSVEQLPQHVPGVECVDNPFCEECYK